VKLEEALVVGFRFRAFVLLLAIALLGPMAVTAQQANPIGATTPTFGYRVVTEYPHDRRAFTQGLAYVDGVLYEGTGQYGESTLRRVDLETGEVLQAVGLSKEYFGEGIAVLGDRIYQLTWRNGICIVFDRETFEGLEVFTYQTEGWGLTTDGEQLIMSDGTNRLFIRDPETFAELDTIDVYDGARAIWNLNELEIVDGEIWANVWQTDRIARIDPDTGQVTGWIDLTGLLSESDRGRHRVDVLNGIAHDPETDRLFVTGKLWPKLFEIDIVPQ
jgi:glutamine cyclotransferase